MTRLIALVLTLAALGATIAWAVVDRQASIDSLNATLSEVDQQIASAESETALYTGGLIKALIDTRLDIYKTTKAMLLQKRAAWLHRIDLRYTIAGAAVEAAPTEALQAIDGDMHKALADAEAAEKESAQYSGGLIKAMIDTRQAVARQTAAMLEQRLLMARYGIPYGVPATQSATPMPSPGHVKPDRDVL